MSSDLQRIRRGPSTTLAAEVARNLVRYLLHSGNIREGDRLPSERQLCEAFAVGRSAVREALKSLNLLGLVEIRQGDGTYFRRPDSELLPQVIEWGLLLGERRTYETVEARVQIEIVIARLAAERRVPEDLTSLSTRLEEMRANQGDAERFTKADVEFHLDLARISGNRVLEQILSSLQSLLQVWIRRVIESADDPQLSYLEHVPIYTAVEQGDPDAAAAAMSAHMDGASARLRQTFGATLAED